MSALLELRATLEVALSSAGVTLGTYTYPTGQTTPALWVDTGRPVPGLEVAGLEVAVYQTPQPLVRPSFSGTVVLRNWQAVIKNWDGEEGATEKAMKAITKAFRAVSEVRFMLGSSETVEMVSFKILG